MAKLEKSLNDTIEEILQIAPKTTVAKISTMLGVSRRSITRTKAWVSRVKTGGRRKKEYKKPNAPLERTPKEALQGQAKFIAVVVHNILEEYYNNPLADNEMKDVIDAVYTALYAINYYKDSSSAEEFFRLHANQVQKIDAEAEFLDEFED